MPCFFGDAYSNEIGGCSNDGHGATNDGGVGERDEKFGGDEVALAADGEHDGHEDHHYWGVVDEAGKHGDDSHHGHQHAHGGSYRRFFSNQLPSASMTPVLSKLALRINMQATVIGAGVGENPQCVTKDRPGQH